MRDYAKVPPQFWINEQGRKIKKLGRETQIVSFYLLTNPHCNMCGIYYLPVTLISHETGLTIEECLKGLHSLINIKFCSYDEQTEYVWVRDTAFDQVGSELKPSDNRVKSINEFYSSLPNLPFLNEFYEKYAEAFCIEKAREFIAEIEAPFKHLSSQEHKQEQEQEQKKIFMSGSHQHTVVEENKRAEKFEKIKQQKSTNILKSQAIQVLEFLNHKTGRAYRPVDANLKLIMARLKSGATLAACHQVIAKKTREWKGDAKMTEYLRPATLFNATKFEQYVGELVLPQEDTKND